MYSLEEWICRLGGTVSAIFKAQAGACVCTYWRGVAQLLSPERLRNACCAPTGHECSLAQKITGAQAQLLANPPKNHKKCRSRNEATKTKLPGGLHQGNVIIDRINTRVQPCFPLPSPKLQQLPFRSSSLGVPTSRTDHCCPTMPVPPCSLWPKSVLSFQSSSTSHFSQT